MTARATDRLPRRQRNGEAQPRVCRRETDHLGILQPRCPARFDHVDLTNPLDALGIDHPQPAGRLELAGQAGNASQVCSSSGCQEDQVGHLAGRLDARGFQLAGEFGVERALYPNRRAGLYAELVEERGRMQDLLRPLLRCRPELQVRALAARDIKPGLAAVLVGDVAASQIYVRSKVQACAELGLYSDLITPPATVTTEEMLSLVAALNTRDDVDGILIQLPLPPQVDSKALLDAVDPAKDVDGFHPVNAGRLLAGRPALAPCTPAGVIEILKRSNIPIAGQHAVVVGRSDIVGKPVAMLLLHQNATVTICHSKTRDLPAITRQAGILVAAIGRPGFITPEMVTPGATLIDVGINRLTTREEFDRFFKGDAKREASFAKRGSTIVGDIDPRAFELSGAYTPVPGGVGLLTIAMLMSNTVRAALMRRELPRRGL